jgi:cytochrome c556
MKTANLVALAIFATVPVGCRAVTETPVDSRATSAAPAASEPTATSAQAALDAMDQRQAVPLLPMMANHQKQNMRDHLRVVQEIVTAVGSNDFDAVQASVARIGYSEQMGQMCQHMGAGAAGFTDLALKFHHTADKIGEAAKANDSDAVLKALSETLATCTSCHQTFKQQVVDDAAWTASTKGNRPTPPMAH